MHAALRISIGVSGLHNYSSSVDPAGKTPNCTNTASKVAEDTSEINWSELIDTLQEWARGGAG